MTDATPAETLDVDPVDLAALAADLLALADQISMIADEFAGAVTAVTGAIGADAGSATFRHGLTGIVAAVETMMPDALAGLTEHIERIGQGAADLARADRFIVPSPPECGE
ncbi:MAG: hypothetical protein QM662_17740 [Gordonia sp. (in: high G+C Gram-positive bacteria)]